MPDKVIGIINYFGPNGEIADTQAFTDAEKYLSAIEKAFDHYGINGWKYATQTNDLDVNYKVYALVADEYGYDSISKKDFQLKHPQYVPASATFGVMEDTPWGRMKVVRQQDFDKAFAQGTTDFSNCYFDGVTFNGEAAEISFQNSILTSDCLFDHGAGMILMDVKGTLYNKAGPELQAKGYCTPVLDLRNVFRSYQFNILYRVNKEIDAWRTAANEEDRVKHYGAAERFAKVAANAIIANVQAHGSNDNQFFIDTARGMITGFILLVALYAPPTARHIISVFELVVQCSAPESLPAPGAQQRTMIASLMEHINDRRIRNYVAPASSADIRTALNIFSSALSHLLKFVDAELEQLICDQSPEFDAQRFIDQPTAIFLICPDENPTRHFLASLFVRSFTDELIELAETKYNETLPRKFLYFLDEFGNMPPIENATALFSAIRSRGGRVMCALQAYDQLRLNYTEHQAATIEKNCHVQMNSAVAPAADKDAKRISEMLGNETILTGSKSKTRGVTTTNTSLIGRPLMSPAQLVTMPIGTFVVQCVSQNPYKSYLPDYSEYLELATEFLHPAPIRKYTPVLVAAPRMIAMNARGGRIEIHKGMFDVADEEW